MAMILTQEVIQPLRNIGRKISFVALLTYIRRDIPDDEQLFTTPDFQSGLARLQFTTA